MHPCFSLLAAADPPLASVKWTVNIDREDSEGGIQRPCQEGKERVGDGGGNDDDGGTQRKRWRGKRGELLPSPKATKCALMHCGREHTVSPERERKSSITHRVHTVSTIELFKMPKRTCALTQDGAYWDVNLILRQLKCIMLISRITED